MENIEPGLKLTAGAVAKAVDETDQVWFSDMALEGWGSHPDLYQILKKLTTGYARQAVMGANRDNGWEPWRRFTSQYEPASAIVHGQQFCELAVLGHKRCSSPQEASSILLEIERNPINSGK